LEGKAQSALKIILSVEKSIAKCIQSKGNYSLKEIANPKKMCIV